MTITDQITALLAADPICGGRVTGETVRAIAEIVSERGAVHEAPEAVSKALVCPYCMKPNIRLRIVESDGDRAVYCPRCGAQGPMQMETDEGAVELWNDFIRAAAIERTDLPIAAIERGGFGAGEG